MKQQSHLHNLVLITLASFQVDAEKETKFTNEIIQSYVRTERIFRNLSHDSAVVTAKKLITWALNNFEHNPLEVFLKIQGDNPLNPN